MMGEWLLRYSSGLLDWLLVMVFVAALVVGCQLLINFSKEAPSSQKLLQTTTSSHSSSAGSLDSALLSALRPGRPHRGLARNQRPLVSHSLQRPLSTEKITT